MICLIPSEITVGDYHVTMYDHKSKYSSKYSPYSRYTEVMVVLAMCDFEPDLAGWIGWKTANFIMTDL